MVILAEIDTMTSDETIVGEKLIMGDKGRKIGFRVHVFIKGIPINHLGHIPVGLEPHILISKKLVDLVRSFSIFVKCWEKFCGFRQHSEEMLPGDIVYEYGQDFLYLFYIFGFFNLIEFLYFFFISYNVDIKVGLLSLTDQLHICMKFFMRFLKILYNKFR